MSCFMWIGALDSSDFLLSYPLISLASPMNNILISTLKHTHSYLPVDDLKIKLHKVKEQLHGCKGQISSNERQIRSLVGKVDSLTNDVAVAQTERDTLQQEKELIQTKLHDVQSTHWARTADVAQSENRALKEEIVQIRGEVTRLQARLDGQFQDAGVSSSSGGGNGGGIFSPQSTMQSDLSPSPLAYSIDLRPSTVRGAGAGTNAYGESKTGTGTRGGSSPNTGVGVQADLFSSSRGSNGSNNSNGGSPSSRAAPAAKWEPSKAEDAISGRLSLVVEDRVLRAIFHRYAETESARGQSLKMTLTRFIRFSKEFHLCFVGSGNNGEKITCTPPYLVGGEIDCIFANCAKMKVKNDESSSPHVRPYGFRAGAGTNKQYAKGNNFVAQTTGLTLTVGQFIEAIKAVSAKLYANIIELQTGTVLECLPPRQRAAASRAVFDVLIKKKLLPIAEKLELVPWPLIYLEQAANIFQESALVVQTVNRNHHILAQWFDTYRTDAPRSAKVSNAVQSGVTYKSMSKFSHDFSLTPYLLKEPNLYGLFQEFMLWSSTRPEEVFRMLPVDVLAFAAEREGKQIQDLPGFNVSTFGQTQTAKFGTGPLPGRYSDMKCDGGVEWEEEQTNANANANVALS